MIDGAYDKAIPFADVMQDLGRGDIVDIYVRPDSYLIDGPSIVSRDDILSRQFRNVHMDMDDRVRVFESRNESHNGISDSEQALIYALSRLNIQDPPQVVSGTLGEPLDNVYYLWNQFETNPDGSVSVARGENQETMEEPLQVSFQAIDSVQIIGHRKLT